MPFDLLCGSVIESQRARTSGCMGERFLKRVVRCALAFLLVLLVAEEVYAHGDHNLREFESERVEDVGTLTSREVRTLTGSLRPETITYQVSGYYDVERVAPATVTVIDNNEDDEAGVRVTPRRLTLKEGLTSEPDETSTDEWGTYEVVLTAKPEGYVRVRVASDDNYSAVVLSPTSLGFTADNWDTARTVTVWAVEDDDARDENVTITHDVERNGHVTAAASVTVTVIDDDEADVRVPPTSLTLEEGETGTYEVVLTAEPEGYVDVTAASDDTSAVVVSGATLRFTADDWDTAQTVTVEAVEDDDARDENVTITHDVSGYGRVTAAAGVTVTVIDNDEAGVRVTPERLTLEEGETGTYEVVLTAEPDRLVEVRVASGDYAVAFQTQTEMLFTADNWDTAQTLTVETLQDDDARDENATITHVVRSYGSNGTLTARVTVTVMDNDEADVRVTPTSLPLEEGETDTYEVVLTSEPEGYVDVTAASDDTSAVVVSGATLRFTADDWDTARTVTVEALADDDAGDESVTITHDVSGYGDVTEADAVTVTVMDDDEAGVRVTPESLPLREGETGTYEVALTSEPTGYVTIAPSVPLGTDVTVSPRSLTFTATDWGTAKALTVTVAEDDDTTTDPVVVLTLTATGGGYETVPPSKVDVVIEEDDHITPTERQVVKEAVRTIAASAVANVTTNIGARFSAPVGGGAVLTLAGQSVLAPAADSGWIVSDKHRGGPWHGGYAFDKAGRNLSAAELLRSSAFQVSLGAAEEGSILGGLSQWTIWGRGDMLFFDSDSSNERYDGDLVAGYMGVDVWLDERWLAGVAASRTGVKADYRLDGGGGELDLTTTAVHPYLRFAPDDRRELWVILGVGVGSIQNLREGVLEREDSKVKLYMGAAGGRLGLAPGAVGGVDVAFLGDLGFGALDSDAGTGLEAIDDLAVETWRARVGVEGSYTVVLWERTTLTPFVEVAGRYDRGGGDNETGVEIAGGVSYADPSSGLGLEARGNVLVLSSQSNYREYGGSMTLSMSAAGGGEGLSLALSPRLGRPRARAGALWRDDPFALAHRRADGGTPVSLEARIGYGVSVPGLRGLLTPFGEVRLWDGDDRRTRFGVRLDRRGLLRDVATLSVFAEQSSTGGGDMEERINLVAQWRF